MIEEEFIVDTDNTIDKRTALDPDRFGYLSLHYVVQLNTARCEWPEYRAYQGLKAEIQIRSILQHTWAEIEHDLGYKSKIEIPRKIQRDFFRLAGLLELADKEFMGIRNSLEAYRSSVQLDIQSNSKPVPIDSVSLQEFINTSKTLKKLNKAICEVANGKLKDYDETTDETIEKLSFVGISSIQQIELELQKNFDLILKIVELVFAPHKNLKGRFNCTIGLLYLCHAILVQKNSTETITEFWNTFRALHGVSEQDLLDLYHEHQATTQPEGS